ncbi:hypothetical protein [Paenibacillus whitsoniae]|uniref:Uncharacterized protein n=1 Tax=Paenibacillus whitsoniae TaxID=2496558 RepID=A0A3S0BTH4_9BACL|nr:hypothetical protein [Paenibacillus whitsoniae]RTE08006.1 hypothetical protein EJQ19_19365 [Paenibacillus whitsoniae]
MKSITESSKNNVILFPKTAQYYEEELARLLRKEQYSDAMQLLAYLLQFPGVDPVKQEQWGALQQWLLTMFPEVAFPQSESLEEEAGEIESDFVRQAIREKSAVDQGEFTAKLQQMLVQGTLEQQVNALEQMAFLDQPELGPFVTGWLTERPRHPHIQFKALQTLRRIGEQGTIALPKNGQQVLLDIEDTPISPEDFPSRIRDMIRRIGDISEISQPDFVYFASQTWQEFLAYAYGTPLYAELAQAEESAVDVWASALHIILQEKLFGMSVREELLDNYGIVDGMTLPWKRAYNTLQAFVKQFSPDPG